MSTHNLPSYRKPLHPSTVFTTPTKTLIQRPFAILPLHHTQPQFSRTPTYLPYSSSPSTMTKPTAAELHAMSEQYRFDEVSINDMALTIGVDNTKAICDFVRSPEKSTAQGPPQATATNGSTPQESSYGKAEEPSRHMPQVSEKAIKQEDRGAAITATTSATDPQNNTATTDGRPKP